MKYLLLVVCLKSTILFSQSNTDIQHSLFDKMKIDFRQEIGNSCDTFRIHSNDMQTKSWINFLNKDFNTKIFNKNKSVKYWACRTNCLNNTKINFEMISMSFESEEDLKAAIKKIKSTKRTNFKLIVQTVFRIKKSKSELLIFYSQTYRNDIIKSFMQKNAWVY